MIQRLAYFLLIIMSPTWVFALEMYDVSSGFINVTSVNGVSTQTPGHEQSSQQESQQSANPLQVAAAAPPDSAHLFLKADNTDTTHKPDVIEMDAQQDAESSSEVVGGNKPTEFSAGDATMRTSLRPKSHPETKPTAEVKETTAPPQANASLYDMRGCEYGKNSTTNSKCYKSMSTRDRARRIMTAVNYVNKLHGTKFDGRYMLCTGWRESNFNPGAKGAAGERGMFQVMRDTGYGAIKYGVELPEFESMTGEQYMTNMKNSTVAQVELSFLVLKMKLSENIKTSACQNAKAARKEIMGGSGTDSNYQNLAGCYNGAGTNSTYAKRVKSCLSCLRTKMSPTATDMGTEIEPCLAKAK